MSALTSNPWLLASTAVFSFGWIIYAASLAVSQASLPSNALSMAWWLCFYYLGLLLGVILAIVRDTLKTYRLAVGSRVAPVAPSAGSLTLRPSFLKLLGYGVAGMVFVTGQVNTYTVSRARSRREIQLTSAAPAHTSTAFITSTAIPARLLAWLPVSTLSLSPSISLSFGSAPNRNPLCTATRAAPAALVASTSPHSRVEIWDTMVRWRPELTSVAATARWARPAWAARLLLRLNGPRPFTPVSRQPSSSQMCRH